jgi:hypothetical protein
MGFFVALTYVRFFNDLFFVALPWGSFVGLAYQGNDILIRFIIGYSSLKDFAPR